MIRLRPVVSFESIKRSTRPSVGSGLAIAALITWGCSTAPSGSNDAGAAGGVATGGSSAAGAGVATGTAGAAGAVTAGGGSGGSSEVAGGATSGAPSGGASGLAGASAGSSTGGATNTAGGGGSAGSAGGVASSPGPCDIFQSASTPCVGAYSTVRALYREFSGSLYQVRRSSDKTTKDIPVLSSGGFADSAVQDAFCTGACTISIIYDQSSMGNHLPVSTPVYWLKNGGTESDATAVKITVGGHAVYGLKGVAGRGNSYRNAMTKGVATGDQAEAVYMVADSKFYSAGCCYDFGNVETSGNADGKGAMETLYWGGAADTWGKGGGTGPWVMADLELGVFGADTKNAVSNTSLVAPAFVTLLLKGSSGNHFGLKGGDAQAGSLITKWDGKRPSGWSPMKKQGAIVLGAGGDGSNGSSGIFFEGAITSGSPPDATDTALQANIVAAGYGR